MHRLNRVLPPPSYHQFVANYPECRDWGFFRDSSAYKDAKAALKTNQSDLCAYCEVRLSADNGKVRIEHFHPKSDADVSHNWMLDWQNIIVVCFGEWDTCDTHKAHVQEGRIVVEGVPKGMEFEGYILNPYDMPHECLFAFEADTGKLKPNSITCERVPVAGNKHKSVQDLVRATIDVLNLNAPRLCQWRKDVNREYENLRKELRQKVKNRHLRECIAERWFDGGRVLQFYTTRRILLGVYAERRIAEDRLL